MSAGAFALAASVAVIGTAGFMTARLLPASGDMQTDGIEQAIAAGPLREALERVASGSVLERGLIQVKPIITVRDHEGRFCRQYTLQRSGAGPVSGFACRGDDGHWSVAFHAPDGTAPPDTLAAGGDASQYQPASGEGGTSLDAFIDKSSSGGVLTGADEADLISKGWPRL